MDRRERERRLGLWLREYGAALWRIAASYESRPALREELMQDIALALWRALPSFRGASSDKTFVLKVATNRALTHLAAREPAMAGPGVLESLPDAGTRPDTAAMQSQAATRLQAAVRRLPLPQRQVMVLALEGVDREDIAGMLGLAAGNVSVRLHRGKERLRELLGGQHD